MDAFTQNILWLSTQIVSEEDCDCLRFISSSVLEINQQHKNVKEIFDQLEKRGLLSKNNIHIVYEALTLMNQIRLRSEFLEKLGFLQNNYKPKPSVISAFTRMLVSVRHTLGMDELSNLIFFYKKGRGAGIIEYEKRPYALLQYLLDKLLLTNDVESLNKFAGVLEVAKSIKGQRYVKRYLQDNPNLPKSAEAQSTQEGLSTATQEDSGRRSEVGTYSIRGNNNVIVIDAQNLNIAPMFQGPKKQQPTYHQKAMDQESPSAQQLVMDNQPTTDHQSAIDNQSAFDQRLSIMQDSEQQKHDSFTEATEQDQGKPRDRDSLDLGYSSSLLAPDMRPSTPPTEFSSPKPLVSLPPSSQPTPPTYKPALPVQPGIQQGSWCEEKKCFRFSQNEIMQMKGEKIGEGGFGIVYKGKWNNESRGEPIDVAIKEYNEEISKGSKQGDEQFQKELSAVEISKHCFAVTVLGFCSDQKYKALVYPYMKKGDLKKLLDIRSPDLTWKIRLRILHQIARVMCHFHNSFELREGASFVHGDVKADNIFVDEHLNAFLGDFGVMEELPDGRTSITRNLQAHAMGYKDPDAVKQFSKSSDVYMFGVVIFRCITSLSAQQGKEPPECESLTSLRQGDIQANCGDLYNKVDKEVWTTDQEVVVKELADLAINCFIRKRNKVNKNRCTFKDILKKLDALMKREEIPGYEDNLDTRCICCQLHPLYRIGPNHACACNSCMCLTCLQKKDMPCPFHVSSEIKEKLTE